MSRAKFKFVNGSWVSVSATSTEAAAPFVQDDTMEPIESMATPNREVFDSKSKYLAHLKQHGYEVASKPKINGPGAFDKRERKIKEPIAARLNRARWGMLPIDEDLRADIAEAQRKVKWGMAPATDEEKERWTKEEREYRNLLKRARH